MSRTWVARFLDDESAIWNWFAAAILVSIPAYWRATDVLFSLLALVIFIRALKDWNFRPIWDSVRVFGVVNWLILGWFVSTVIGYMLTAGLGSEQVEEILGLRWLLSLYLSAYLGARLSFSRKALNWLFIVLSLVMVGTIWSEYHAQFMQLFSLEWIPRYEGTFGNASAAACALGVLWGAYLGWGNFSKTAFKQYSWSLFFLFLLTSYCIFTTQSRGTWAALAIVFLIYALLVPSWRNIWAGIVVASISVVLYWYNLFGFKERINYSWDWSSGNSQGMRLGLWRAHWEIFLDHFWFGTGFWEPLRLLPEYYARLEIDNRMPSGEIYYSHAHNHVLHILAGSGILGFSFFTSAFILTVIYLLKKWKSFAKDSLHKKCALVCILALAAFLANGFVDTPFLIHSARVLILFILGVFVGLVEIPGHPIMDRR